MAQSCYFVHLSDVSHCCDNKRILSRCGKCSQSPLGASERRISHDIVVGLSRQKSSNTSVEEVWRQIIPATQAIASSGVGMAVISDKLDTLSRETQSVHATRYSKQHSRVRSSACWVLRNIRCRKNGASPRCSGLPAENEICITFWGNMHSIRASIFWGCNHRICQIIVDVSDNSRIVVSNLNITVLSRC